MKRLIFLFSACMMASVSMAASLNWSASDWGSSLTGTAYLIQYTGSETVNIAQIADYLENKGTEYEGTAFQKLGQTDITDSISLGNNGTAITVADTLPSLDNCFTLIITNDGHFVLSSFETITNNTVGGNNMYSISFTTPPFGNTEWTTGDVYSGEEPVDPNVPEPSTCLMLTLLAAGVVLKRRTR